MIRPPAHKMKCPKYAYSKNVAPKRDALNPMDILSIYCVF